MPPPLAAACARVSTAAGFTRMLGPLGNYLIARPAARAAAHGITEQTDVPLDAAMVLGLSGDALHVWSADPMLNQVGDHLGPDHLAGRRPGDPAAGARRGPPAGSRIREGQA